MHRSIVILVLLGWFLFPMLLPAHVGAAAGDVVIITAQPSAGNVTCPWNFTISVSTLYEIQLSWTPGGNATDTMIRGGYGRWPESATDGFEVYHGNTTSFTHWVNTEFIGVNVYYRVYDEYADGTYSTCYVSGSVTGGASVSEMAEQLGLFVTLLKYLSLPFLLLILSVWKRNIGTIIAGIISFAIVAPPVADSIGNWILAPIVTIIIMLGLMILRDVWERQIEA